MEKKKLKEKAPAQEIVSVEQPKKELVLEGDPEKQLDFAMKAANALMKAVAHKPKKVMIRGEQYLEYGDWQTLARFFGATAAIEWTHPLKEGDKTIGYEARATVLHNGQVISSAEAMCLREERNWKDRDEFMLRSMAQTRASAKALRNAYGWVAELAGMKSTPAEEMGDMYDTTPVPTKAKVTVSGTDTDEVFDAYPDTPENDMPRIPNDRTQQKIIIMTLLKHRGVDTTNRENIERFIADETQLLLVPENFKEIITILSR